MKKRKKIDINKWNVIRVYILLPTGETIGVTTYTGEGVPEELTTFGYMKMWQKSISKDIKRGKVRNIVKSKEKCPKCGGRIYKAVGIDGKTRKWCGNYPYCDYKELVSKQVNSPIYVCPNCGDFLSEKINRRTKTIMYQCDSCSFVTDDINKVSYPEL